MPNINRKWIFFYYFCVKFGPMIEKFHKMEIFTLEDANKIIESKEYTMKVLRDYVSRGLLIKIRRNLYAVTNLATKHIAVSKYKIGSAITPSAYIAYHSALEYYGLANQVFYDLFICSDSRFNNFEFDGITYMYVKSPIATGVETPIMSKGIKITSLERTVIDCINRIEYCGGSEELLHCLKMVLFLDENKLLEILESYNNMTLYKKAGFVLDFFKDNLKLSDMFFDECKKKNTTGSKLLTSYESCPNYNSEWKIYYPSVFNEIDFNKYGSL